ncbi:MAG: hypothetical protein Q9192_008781 [Flavoplaca navasiana]
MDDFSEDDEIAQSMGFTSFGSNKPTKKRRFNTKIDAAIDSTTNNVIAGSGGNSIPLGRRKARGIGDGGRGRGMVEEDEGLGGDGGGGFEVEGEEGDPEYVDDTPPPDLSPEIEAGEHKVARQPEDRMVSAGGGEGGGIYAAKSAEGQYQNPDPHPTFPPPSSSSSTSIPPKPLFALVPSIQTSAATTPLPTGQSTSSTRTSTAQEKVVDPRGNQMSRDEAHQLKRGIRDRNGDIAYYSPSFVEDPWSKFDIPTSSLPPPAGVS